MYQHVVITIDNSQGQCAYSIVADGQPIAKGTDSSIAECLDAVEDKLSPGEDAAEGATENEPGEEQGEPAGAPQPGIQTAQAQWDQEAGKRTAQRAAVQSM